MKLPKVYEPGTYESDIYALWEKSDAFKPSDGEETYSIVMPPPNANANLHIGYELTVALEDITARYQRLQGKSVLLLPGADHAGFETQSVYEKQLVKEGKSRFDFSREELYQRIWDFVALNRGNFETQLRQMGVSCDWSHYTFTLDSKIVSRAYATFKKMWDEGLIYRGERLVNFCTFHGTAFADIEVVHKEEQGQLWYINYPLTDGSGTLTVATTRPETILGDTAVAVHPDDPRYKSFVGKTVKLPLSNREIPVIADRYVDQTFGTGAVKITPAHDPNDFEVGKRHDLPMLRVITYEGTIGHDALDTYRGLHVEEARTRIIEDLKAGGYLEKTEHHVHNVGHCYKCDTVIQPLLREQWFVDMQPLAARATEVLKKNTITFFPASKRDQLVRYLEGLHDWNISRQIAWGIPIPAFQNVDDPDDWIFDTTVSEEILTFGDKSYRRDPDTFDTWFSSSSWPYATLDFPDSEDFKRYYPLSLMETGGEILQPWVSRMLMLGLYITDEVPFKEVYIHGYVMAEDGSKMSKSIGNVVDPLPVIARYGSDALRLGIITGRQAAVNRGYDERKVEDGRNFCNKLWNIARFVEDLIGDKTEQDSAEPTTRADHWVLSRLAEAQHKLTTELDSYRISEAYETLYHFVWDDVADWYIETSKAEPNKALLAHLLESVLLLAHPFAPFVTETIWQTLAWENDSLLATKQYKEVLSFDTAAAAEFSELQRIILEARFITKALKVTGASLYYSDAPLLASSVTTIQQLARLKTVSEANEDGGIYLTSTKYRCWLDIDNETAQAYATEIEAKQSRQQQVIDQLTARLSNTTYTDNAPEAVVRQSREQLKAAEELMGSLESEYRRFSAA
jgi:valyl-tRNA synthetase